MRRYLSAPLLLLGVGILAFGIQASWLGFYLDDWVVLYQFTRGGFERLAAYTYAVNRPFGAWPWMLGLSLLHYSPLAWQIWSLVWRWLTALLLWLAWKRIWPEKKLQISLAATLFMVYPIFIQQTNAVTFSDQWICFALFALSIVLMVYSFEKRQFRIPFTGLALLFSGLQLFTIEYYVGLEFIRPVLMWFLFRDSRDNKSRMKKVIFSEIPYGLVLTAFLIWRFFFIATPGYDRNSPHALIDIVKHPLQGISDLSVKAIQDLVEALLGTWYKTYNPSTITLSPISTVLSWAVVIIAFGLSLLFFIRFLKADPENSSQDPDAFEWLWINLAVMIAGFLPAWATGLNMVSSGNYADRFGLAAMFGASLFIVSGIGILLKQRRQVVLVCILVGLATGYHFRLANQFRYNWESQTRLAQQFIWRIPGLEPNTAVYGDGIMATGSWVDIAWLNFLYSKPSDQINEDYWYFDLNKFNQDSIPVNNQSLDETRMEHLTYTGNTSNSLVIQFKSTSGQCLWVLSEDDKANPFINDKVRRALPLSNLNRIKSSTNSNPNIREIFPASKSPQWCYYFEKAQLALHEKQWDEIKSLWQEASNAKLKTSVAIEYLPFIEGIANGGDIPTAFSISQRAESIDVKVDASICTLWKQIALDPTKMSEDIHLQEQVNKELGCDLATN